MASKTYRICTLPGDGIGPEILEQAVRVLQAVGERYDVEFICTDALLGGIAIDETGDPFPPETLAAAKAADAVLLAAVGGPKWDTTDPDKPRPEQGLLGIRKELGLFANIRPVKTYRQLVGASTLRPEVVDGVDLVIVRELTGGLYFGARDRKYDVPGAGVDGAPGQQAYDTMSYSEYEVDRIVREAFRIAKTRRNKVTNVDKANVLESCRMWREVEHRIAGEFPEVENGDMLVDNAAMQLVRNPTQFDVIVCENTFGDILSDEASMLTGSLGMLASASLGSGTALYEPSHGSAPDIAGLGVANPLAQIISVELMLSYSFGMRDAADDIERAIEETLAEGYRTRDLADASVPADKVVGCAGMGDLIVAKVRG